MTRFAANTEVSAERSEAEIKRTLVRYGADDVVTGMSSRLRKAFVQFHYKDLPIQVSIPLPNPGERRFQESPTGKVKRSEDAAQSAWEAACRQQWRVLLLLIKANLEAIENGIVAAKDVFLPWLMLPNGLTVGEMIRPQLDSALAGGKLKALPFPGENEP